MTRFDQLELIIKQLEQRITHLESRLNDSDWCSLSDAAEHLKCNAETIRRKIREAKVNHKIAKFKKGIHWREKGKHYQINLRLWEAKMCDNKINSLN